MEETNKRLDAGSPAPTPARRRALGVATWKGLALVAVFVAAASMTAGSATGGNQIAVHWSISAEGQAVGAVRVLGGSGPLVTEPVAAEWTYQFDQIQWCSGQMDESTLLDVKTGPFGYDYDFSPENTPGLWNWLGLEWIGDGSVYLPSPARAPGTWRGTAGLDVGGDLVLDVPVGPEQMTYRGDGLANSVSTMTGAPCNGSKLSYIATTVMPGPLCTTEETRFWRFDDSAGTIAIAFSPASLPVGSGLWNTWLLWHCAGTGTPVDQPHGWSTIHAGTVTV